jgi:hypothetical protein
MDGGNDEVFLRRFHDFGVSRAEGKCLLLKKGSVSSFPTHCTNRENSIITAFCFGSLAFCRAIAPCAPAGPNQNLPAVKKLTSNLAPSHCDEEK